MSSALEVYLYTTMRYINRCFTYLLTYLHSSPNVQHVPVYEAVFRKQRDRSFAADVAMEPRLVCMYWHHWTRPRRRQRYLCIGRIFRQAARCYLWLTCIAKCCLFLYTIKTWCNSANTANTTTTTTTNMK